MIPYRATVVTPAVLADEPITLEEAKLQLRIDSDYTDEDALIQFYISAVRDRAENYCNRYFAAQTVKWTWMGAPRYHDRIILPAPDITSISSVSFADSTQTETVAAPSTYTYLPLADLLYFADGVQADVSHYTIEAVVKAPAEMDGAKAAMLLMLGDLFDLRAEGVVGTTINVNPAVKALLDPYRINLGI